MLKILGRVKNGEICVQRFFQKELLSWEGKSVEIEKVGESKTLQQLRYLWGVVYKIISDDTGFTPEEVSEIYKKKFLSYPKEHKGKIYHLTKGLSTLKKDEMKEFIDKVIKHATADLGLIIPEPDSEFEYPEE